MLDFIAAVFFFNLIFGVLLFAFRHRIPITTPVLALAALVSFTCTISLPYLAAKFEHPAQALVLLGVILLSAILLGLLDSRHPAPARDASVSGNTAGLECNDGNSRGMPEISEPQVVFASLEQAEQLAATVIEVHEIKASGEPAPVAETEIPASTEVVSMQSMEPGDTVPGMAKQDIAEVYTETTTLIVEPQLEQEAEPEIKETEIEQITQAETGEALVSEASTIDSAIKPEPAEYETMADVAEQDYAESGLDSESGLRQIIAQGFAYKEMGHYVKAAQTFYKALQMQPEPKLAILMLVEISDIYSNVGQNWQAAEILKILLATWSSYLDEDMKEHLESKINKLQDLLN